MKVGDFVGRKKYQKDVLFEIFRIENQVAYLRGVEMRLIADSPLDDLEIMPLEKQQYVDEGQLLREAGRIKGKILHLDGDESYLEICEQKYRELGVKAYCVYMKESDMKDEIVTLLEKYQPDILVITGHDALSKKGDPKRLDDYMHSRDFIETLKKAREYDADKDHLIIFAGACQSYYEMLLAAGANFASSPDRMNIHALDPVYIASQVANESIRHYVDLEKIVKNTSNKEKGIGGIETKGVARKIFPDK